MPITLIASESFLERSEKVLSKLDHLALLCLQSPPIIGVVASFGFLGHALVTGKKATRKRLIGGLMLSFFVGVTAAMLLKGLGTPDLVGAAVATILGASCLEGYTVMLKRAQVLLALEDKDADCPVTAMGFCQHAQACPVVNKTVNKTE